MKYETDLLDQMQKQIKPNVLIHSWTQIWYRFLIWIYESISFWTVKSYDYSSWYFNEVFYKKVQNDIKTNARLKLPDDPVKNIWSYYGTTKLTPIILENFLMLILTVPLIDTSLQMNLLQSAQFAHSTSCSTSAS